MYFDNAGVAIYHARIAMLYSLVCIGGGVVEFTKEVERLLMNEEEPVQELWRLVS